MVILTVDQMRKEEERGFESGISYEKMMRTAGVGVADAVIRKYGDEITSVTVVCGKGKNGGDGFVAAKRFFDMGFPVSVVLALGVPTDELAFKMYSDVVAEKIAITDYSKDKESALEAVRTASCLIDAVFGIGFSGALGGELPALAADYNSSRAVKVAVDLPSGLCADKSEVPECCFKADFTVTMHALKRVHVFSPSNEICGETEIVDIGFHMDSDVKAPRVTEFSEVAGCFVPRGIDTNKGDYGFALSVCGSYRMPGAAVLAARAAQESGAGLVAAAFPSSAYSGIVTKLTEQIFVPCPSDGEGFFDFEASSYIEKYIQKASAVLFGCGCGTGNGAAAVLEYIINTAKCPLILDADGINIVSANIDLLKELKVPTLLTPHPGEMARLTGIGAADINASRVEVASEFAKEHAVNILLKGSRTVIATPDGAVYVNTTGNPGMATGGSGDMLSGIILSLAAQGMNLVDAARCGAYIHGMCGDLAAKRYSKMGTTPLRMLSELPSVLLQIEKAM